MSHEGIRIVPKSTARRATADERALPQAAIQPRHVGVNQTEGTGVEIIWQDGHISQWSFRWLRDACPCATCIEERQAVGRAPGDPPPQPKAALPLYKPTPRPQKIEPVGRYAIRFEWNDGHTSGIYSWHWLRSHCTCQDCRRTREGPL